MTYFVFINRIQQLPPGQTKREGQTTYSR